MWVSGFRTHPCSKARLTLSLKPAARLVYGSARTRADASEAALAGSLSGARCAGGCVAEVVEGAGRALSLVRRDESIGWADAAEGENGGRVTTEHCRTHQPPVSLPMPSVYARQPASGWPTLEQGSPPYKGASQVPEDRSQERRVPLRSPRRIRPQKRRSLWIPHSNFPQDVPAETQQEGQGGNRVRQSTNKQRSF